MWMSAIFAILLRANWASEGTVFVDVQAVPFYVVGLLFQPCPAVIYHELTPNLIVIAGVAIGISVVLVSFGFVFRLDQLAVSFYSFSLANHQTYKELLRNSQMHVRQHIAACTQDLVSVLHRVNAELN